MSIYASHEKEFPARDYLGSHIYPSRAEPPDMTLELAHIPAYCVPGHSDDEGTDWPANGEWLRLGISHLPSGWVCDVILDRGTARDLAAALNAWADTPELRPTAEHATQTRPTAPRSDEQDHPGVTAQGRGSNPAKRHP